MKESKDVSQQRPEDYMDEEDIREAEESRHLHTAQGFTGFGTEDDEKRKGSLIDLFRSSTGNMGVKLLQKMGWREGQGIGPRVKRAANLDEHDADSDEKHMFAPEDVVMIAFSRKTDYKGIGYDGEARLNDDRHDDQQQSMRTQTNNSDDENKIGDEFAFVRKGEKSAKNSKKSGFGVGILNDTGSDDEDPYSMGPRISYNRVIGGDKKSKKKGISSNTNANPSLKQKPVFVPKKLATLKGSLRKCHDGRLPLDGFVLGDELDSFATMSLQDDKYKPPAVPDGWKSSRTPESEIDNSVTAVPSTEVSKTSSLDAKSRAELLGESQLPGKSVFDYLTKAARDRLVSATGKTNLPPGMGERQPSKNEASEEETRTSLQALVPQLDQDIALQVLNRGSGGWMPYGDDEGKRLRYRTYLEIRAGLRSTAEGDEIPPKADGMSQEDWVLEMQEFAQAAQVFKPVTGLMASRFTSSKSTSGSLDSKGDGDGDGTESLLRKPISKPEDPAESAAKMGLFGPATRSVINFYPTRLLCKRFGVPLPDQPDQAFSQDSERQNAPYFQDVRTTAKSTDQLLLESHKSTGLEPGTHRLRPEDDLNVADDPSQLAKTGTVDPDQNNALEQERPGQAVFRAIFGSDDEDEDEDD